MEKQEMIDKIYEVIANKKLTPWCKLIHKEYEGREIIITNYWYEYKSAPRDVWGNNRVKPKWIIIWHPVMIWDVLDRMKWNRHARYERHDLLNLIFYWKEAREQIEKQNIECIEWVYDLIINNGKK